MYVCPVLWRGNNTQTHQMVPLLKKWGWCIVGFVSLGSLDASTVWGTCYETRCPQLNCWTPQNGIQKGRISHVWIKIDQGQLKGFCSIFWGFQLSWASNQGPNWGLDLKGLDRNAVQDGARWPHFFQLANHGFQDIVWLNELQPKFRWMESRVVFETSLFFWNGAGAWKTIIHSSKNNHICLYTKT